MLLTCGRSYHGVAAIVLVAATFPEATEATAATDKVDEKDRTDDTDDDNKPHLGGIESTERCLTTRRCRAAWIRAGVISS